MIAAVDQPADMPSGLVDIVLKALENHDVRAAGYVADHMLDVIADRLRVNSSFRLLSAAREDEAIGYLSGLYLGGVRGVMLMQSSGFGQCINALASFVLPYQIPIPMIVGMRGSLTEFNVAQMAGGQALPDICRSLAIPFAAPTSLDHLAAVADGLFTTAYSTGRPICIGIDRNLT